MFNNSIQFESDCKLSFLKEQILENVLSEVNRPNEDFTNSKKCIQKNYEMVPVVSDTQILSKSTNNNNLDVSTKTDRRQTIPKIKIRAIVPPQEQESNGSNGEQELRPNGLKKYSGRKRKKCKIKKMQNKISDELEDSKCKESNNRLSDKTSTVSIQCSSKHKAKRNMKKIELKKLHPSLYNFQCNVCGFMCKSWNSLRTHCKDSHQAAAQVTCSCGKVVMTRTALIEHRAFHADNTVYRCDKCEKTFHRKSLLNLHVMSHVPKEEQPFVCCKCARRFHCEALLRNHERVHLPKEERLVYPCHLCHKKFSSKSAVSAHLKAIHLGERPFVCDQCGHSFTSKGILQEHLTIHSDDAPWNCAKCNKNFKTKYRLKIHMDTHRETPYQCPKCPVQLSTRRTLRMHLVVHRDTKAYQCSTCGKAFRRAKDLKNHNNLHTGRRPYTCPFCARTFANGSNCRSHKRRMHPEELQLYEASLLLKNDNMKTTINILQSEEKDMQNIKENKDDAINLSAAPVSVLSEEKKSNFSFNFNQPIPPTSLLTFAAARNLTMMGMGSRDYSNAPQNLLSRNNFNAQFMGFPINQHFFSNPDAEHSSTVPAFPGNPYIHHQSLLFSRASSNN